MTVDDEKLDQLIAGLISDANGDSRWNATTRLISITKVVISLERGTLYADVKAEAERLQASGNFHYMEDFFQSVERLQNVIDIDQHHGAILERVLEMLKSDPETRTLYENFYRLRSTGLIKHLGSFNDRFRGLIQKIYPCDTFHVIKALVNKKGEEEIYFYAVVQDKFLSECWYTLDEALAGALAMKHDGSTRAGAYFCRMIGVYGFREQGEG